MFLTDILNGPDAGDQQASLENMVQYDKSTEAYNGFRFDLEKVSQSSIAYFQENTTLRIYWARGIQTCSSGIYKLQTVEGI